MKNMLFSEMMRLPAIMQAELINNLQLDTVLHRQGSIQKADGSVLTEGEIRALFKSYIDSNTESDLKNTVVLEETYIVHASEFELDGGNDPAEAGIENNQLTLLVRPEHDMSITCTDIIDNAVSDAVAELTGCLINNYCLHVEKYNPYQIG